MRKFELAFMQGNVFSREMPLFFGR